MKGVHVATNNVTDNIKELEKEREGEQLSVNYYMAQATFGEITCSNWLRRVTCRPVIFRIGPVRITGFVSHFVYK